MIKFALRVAVLGLLLAGPATALPVGVKPSGPGTYVVFNGVDSSISVPSAPAISLSSSGYTVAVWVRPDSLTFGKTEGSLASQQYVHWLGKGEKGDQEWTFRMYSQTSPGPRQNRISFYVFSPQGGLGCGSYFQDSITPGDWMLVTGVMDPATHEVSIYKNGILRHSDSYASLATTPQGGAAPLRIGSKDLVSYFKGAIGPIWIWNRPLLSREVLGMSDWGIVPANGLVLHFGMDEGSGDTIHDSVGGRTGSLSNASWGKGGGPVDLSTGRSGGGC